VPGARNRLTCNNRFTRFPVPWTRYQLQRLYSDGRARNDSVVMNMGITSLLALLHDTKLTWKIIQCRESMWTKLLVTYAGLSKSFRTESITK
jgi:hypothetical protein